MDEQNPRLAADRVAGRADEQVSGYDTSAVDPRAPESVRPRTTAAQQTASRSSSASTEPRTREIRAEIEQTREQMSETVDAIQERLRPSTMAANAADSVREAAREGVRNVAESDSVQYARANPIPTAMVGIGIAGLAWLALGGNQPRYSRGDYRRETRDWNRRFADDRERSYEGQSSFARYGTAAGYTPGLSYSDTDAYYRERSAYARGDWQRTGEEMTASARQAAARAQQTARRTWNENPMLVGAASAVLGAMVALAIPETEAENEWMGETRDTLVDSVQETVRDKVSQVQDAASNAVGTVQEAARNAVGLDDSASGATRERG